MVSAPPQPPWHDPTRRSRASCHSGLGFTSGLGPCGVQRGVVVTWPRDAGENGRMDMAQITPKGQAFRPSASKSEATQNVH
jgi:hypothetical protein